MIERRHNAPRGYFIDAQGHRVLIGLSLEETAELEALDLALNETVQFVSEICVREGAVPADEIRWRELYSRHEGTRQAWIAQSQAGRPRDSGFVNYA
ncbi:MULTISPECIES: hypothetical protein [Bradyrhizobium]|uniref:hypothetical protein n=1 Tax=Bradyrhizobium TaxID=374 RepID=UPI0004AF34F0|nr:MULTISPECIES: hypothetical protein [unclassified Bradyrhizobium]MDA9427369.1 hypothetical protein [Bradyrhizobium sp. CCBAU 53380]